MFTHQLSEWRPKNQQQRASKKPTTPRKVQKKPEEDRKDESLKKNEREVKTERTNHEEASELMKQSEVSCGNRLFGSF
jgi:hypothetical protein